MDLLRPGRKVPRSTSYTVCPSEGATSVNLGFVSQTILAEAFFEINLRASTSWTNRMMPATPKQM